MGRCLEFGPVITEGCAHAMRAGSDSCACEGCGAVCNGLFDGCSGVWARGPQPVTMLVSKTISRPNGQVAANGDSVHDVSISPRRSGRGLAHLSPTDANAGKAEVFRWFENAFEALHDDLRQLHGSKAQEPAKVADPVGQHDAEPQPLPSAPSLDAPNGAVSHAVTEHTDDLQEAVADAVVGKMQVVGQAVADSEAGRIDALERAVANAVAGGMGAVERAVANAVAGRMDALERAVANAVAGRMDAVERAVADSVTAQMEAIVEFVSKQLEGVESVVVKAAARRMASIEQSHAVSVDDLRFELQDGRVAHDHALAALHVSVDEALAAVAEASRHADRLDAARLKALKGSIARHLEPLSDAVNQSNADLATIVRQLEQITQAVSAAPRLATTPAAGRATPAPSGRTKSVEVARARARFLGSQEATTVTSAPLPRRAH